jgi:hypothetical protein
MRRVRRLTTTGLVALGVLAGSLGFAATPALAVSGYGFTGSFGSAGSGNGQFNEPLGVAVNEVAPGSVGDVYAIDRGNRRVEVLSSTGAYVSQFNGSASPTGAFSWPAERFGFNLLPENAIAVDNSTNPLDPSKGDVYVMDTGNSVIDKFEAKGGYLGQIAMESSGVFGGMGLAVDPTGTLWVYRNQNGAAIINRYSDALSNELLSSLGPSTPGGVGSGFAVDSEGNLYLNSFFRHFTKDNSAGETLIGELDGEASAGATVDESNNQPYINEVTGIARFSPSGSLLERFGGQARLTGGSGIAVNSATGTIYAADSVSDRVDIFMPGVAEAPVIESESASGVKSAEATLEAQINPDNQSTTYTFEYSTSATGETLNAPVTSLPGAGPLEGFGNQTASAPTGAVLEPGTTYFYRVIAKNASSEESVGKVQSLTTVPVPVTEAPNPIGGTSATFHGHLQPLNEKVATQYHFDYKLGSECTGESSTPSEEAGTGAGTEVAEGVTVGLQPDREYTACFVASNASGEALGSPVTFSTLILPPEVDHESFSALTPFAVTIETEVNPNNQLTLCEVEYGTDPTLATNTITACETSEGVPGWLPGEFGERAASARVEGLEADTTYYYRVIANALESGEKGEGAIQSFTTVGPPQPSTGEAQSITRVTAALSGTVDPERGAGTYYFAYIDQAGFQAALAKGAENPYAEGAATAEHEVAVGEAPQAVQPLLAVGLLPETTYHYALVARNGAGTVIGNDMTFTTGGATPPIVTTGPSSAITLSTATISGTLDTQGLNVSYAFEVSTEPGNPGPPSGGGSIGAGPTEASVSLGLQGLRPGTTYYYRLLATSTDGTSYGTLQALTTPGFPSPLTQPATPPLIGTPAVSFPAGSEANTGKTTETKTLTKAQKLAAALKACHAKHGKQRTSCEKVARKRFGPTKAKKGTKKK